MNQNVVNGLAERYKQAGLGNWLKSVFGVDKKEQAAPPPAPKPSRLEAVRKQLSELMANPYARTGAGVLGGGALGAGIGALAGGKKNRLLGTLVGAGAGGAVGGVALSPLGEAIYNLVKTKIEEKKSGQ